MRFSSLHYRAAAATRDATMSSYRSSYRGRGRNSWRRGFSTGERDEFVSGDSHFTSVADANRSFRPNQPGHHRYPSPSPPPFQQQPPPFRQQQFSSPPPPFYQQQPPLNQHPPPPFHQQHHPPFHQRQPQSSYRQPPPPSQTQPSYSVQPRRPPNYKPPDYRHWQYALTQPPSHCERFIVVSYNILADYLALDHRRELYCHIPRHVLDWEWRRRKILFELGLWSPDIMCLQEVDRFQELEEELKLCGYSGIWKMRTGVPVDGCAIFWRATRFKLLHEESIEYNKLGLRDNVAQICVLESQNHKGADIGPNATSQSSSGVNRVVICNTHVLYNPKRGEIKLGQVRVLLERAYSVSRLWDDAPVIICGDFNCTPKSPLYDFISQQKLDLMGLPRDQISGQSSAEINTSRPYGPGFRVQTPDISNQASMVGEVKEAGVKQGGLHNHNELNRDGGRAPSTENFHQPQNATGLCCTSERSCSDITPGVKNNAVSDESSKETELTLKDSSLDEVRLRNDVQVELTGVVDKGTMGIKENEISPESNVFHAESRSGEKLENAFSQHVTSNLVQDISFGIENKVSLLESFKYSSVALTTSGERTNSSTSDQSLIGVDICNISTCAGSSEDQKLFPSNKLGDGTEEDESFAEAHTRTLFLEVHRTEDEFQADVDSDNKSSEPDSTQDTSFADGGNIPLSESLGSSPPELTTGKEKTEPLGNPQSQFTTSEEKIELSTSEQSVHEVDVSYVSTSVGLNNDQKLVAINKPGEITEECENFGQPCTRILSPEVCSTDVFQSDLDHGEKSVRPESGEADHYLEKDAMSPPPCDEIQGTSIFSIDSGIVASEKYTYDPSSWTPMEIQKASGNEECTLLEHPLKLRSTYAEVEDFSGTRDSSREPQVTSYNRRFMGTVDYIWRSEGLQTVKVLDTIPKHALQWTPGFPTQKWGSDHIALASQLAFTKGLGRF